MAVIDLGPFTDSAADRGATTRVEVPDAGSLPPLPEALGRQAAAGAVWLGGGYGLGGHRWVGVELNRGRYSAQSLLLVYAAGRAEWVCLGCQSDYSPYGFLHGEHVLIGPYRVGPELMGCVLRAYRVPAGAAPPGDLARCHPDRLQSAGEASGAPDRGGTDCPQE